MERFVVVSLFVLGELCISILKLSFFFIITNHDYNLVKIILKRKMEYIVTKAEWVECYLFQNSRDESVFSLKLWFEIKN